MVFYPTFLYYPQSILCFKSLFFCSLWKVIYFVTFVSSFLVNVEWSLCYVGNNLIDLIFILLFSLYLLLPTLWYLEFRSFMIFRVFYPSLCFYRSFILSHSFLMVTGWFEGAFSYWKLLIISSLSWILLFVMFT